MVQKTNLQFVEPLRKKMQAYNRNKQCIVHECTKKPAHSHVIAEPILGLLKDAQGKVLTWEHTDEEILVNLIRGNTWNHIYQQPKRIGIGKDATYPIFCDTHDNDIFTPLEKPGYHSETEQVALLAYRALCYKTWNPHLGEKLEFELTNQDPKTALELRRIFSLNTILAARKKFEYIVRHKDYREMRWIKRIFRIDPCFACTDATIPFDGEEDAINIASGKTILTPEDYITFTFYPEEKLNASICIITWFKDNQRGEGFVEDLKLGNPSEELVRNIIVTRALSMSLVYTSQKFWHSLSPEEKDYLVRLQMRRIPLAARSQN